MSGLPPARIAARDVDSVTLALDLSRELPVFAGHFPLHPVLPGVAQIDWALAFAATELGLGQRAGSGLRVKFRRVITPPARASLQLRLDRTRRRLHFAYRLGQETASEGSILLDAP
jgi:3-hydroxymyristoyl/3-hydroxydecanoyl-(acyl carrier protein) dehydratase